MVIKMLTKLRRIMDEQVKTSNTCIPVADSF